MLINTLNKKYLAEEQSAAPPPIVSGSDDSNSMEVAYDHSNVMLIGSENSKEQQIEDNSMKELEELFCATCGDVHTSLRNQLVECSDCHLLYHQDCHKPAINDADSQSAEWQCSKCRTSILVDSVLTSSSSTSSSPTVFATKTSSSSSPLSSSSSSKSSSHRKSGTSGGSISKSGNSKSTSGTGGSGSGGGGSSSGMLSADKRLANMMKKKSSKGQKTK